ncbi:MAG: HAD family phosphatase [Clostridia bacterium]|nr:HAD family phosphatase [Clostridia bacterium]
MIRNIVFDMGQVLIRFSPDLFMDREGIQDPEERKIVMNELFLSAEWAQMDLGTLTEESAEKAILPRIPDGLREKTRHLLWHWADDREMIDGMEELVGRLKEAGYGLYLLSNASTAQHQYWPRFPVSRLFDGKLISCDHHIVKPNPEIYRRLTETFGLRPEECLFIDDAPANVAAALGCGWDGIVFHGDAEELKRKLASKGILFDAPDR